REENDFTLCRRDYPVQSCRFSTPLFPGVHIHSAICELACNWHRSIRTSVTGDQYLKRFARVIERQGVFNFTSKPLLFVEGGNQHSHTGKVVLTRIGG